MDPTGGTFTMTQHTLVIHGVLQELLLDEDEKRHDTPANTILIKSNQD